MGGLKEDVRQNSRFRMWCLRKQKSVHPCSEQNAKHSTLWKARAHTLNRQRQRVLRVQFTKPANIEGGCLTFRNEAGPELESRGGLAAGLRDDEFPLEGDKDPLSAVR